MASITETECGVVYLLTSPSGKQYVGQSWDLPNRKVHYRHGNCSSQRALHNAIVKYGWESFSVSVIAQGIQTQSALDATESAFISMLGTLSPRGYNLMSGGRGGKHSAETKAKMRGRKHSAETRAKLSAAHRGKPKSPDAVAKTAAANRGRKHTVEARAKMSAANRGRKHTAETRAKIGAAQRGKSLSPEHRAKISAAQRGEKSHMFGKCGEKSPMFGKKHTVETRAKMSAAKRGEKNPMFGKSPSAETRAKKRASAKAFLARKQAAGNSSTMSLF